MFSQILKFFQRKPTFCDGAILYRRLIEPKALGSALKICHLPDTFDNRFEVLALCAALKFEGEKNRHALERDFMAALITDLDNSFREQSLGDSSVKKHATNHAAAFYGRLRAYGRMHAGQEDAPTTLRRNLYGDTTTAVQEMALAQLLPQLKKSLKRIPN